MAKKPIKTLAEKYSNTTKARNKEKRQIRHMTLMESYQVGKRRRLVHRLRENSVDVIGDEKLQTLRNKLYPFTKHIKKQKPISAYQVIIEKINESC